jgi:hypothetical protein
MKSHTFHSFFALPTERRRFGSAWLFGPELFICAYEFWSSDDRWMIGCWLIGVVLCLFTNVWSPYSELYGWSVDRPTDRPTDWLTDWLSVCPWRVLDICLWNLKIHIFILSFTVRMVTLGRLLVECYVFLVSNICGMNTWPTDTPHSSRYVLHLRNYRWVWGA